MESSSPATPQRKPGRRGLLLLSCLTALTLGVVGFYAIERLQAERAILPPVADDMTYRDVVDAYGDATSPSLWSDATPGKLNPDMLRAHPADKAMKDEPAGLPVYDGATQCFAFQRDAHGEVVQTVQWTLPDEPMARIADTYIKAAKDRGFGQIGEAKTNGSSASYRFARAHPQMPDRTQILIIHLRPAQDGRKRVMIQLRWRNDTTR